MLNYFISMLTSMMILYQEWLNFLGGVDIPIIIVLSLVTFMFVEMIWHAGVESRARMIQSYLTEVSHKFIKPPCVKAWRREN